MADVKVRTLAEFLLARIAEDEAVARAAADDQGATWAAAGEEYVYPDPSPGNSYVATGPWGGGIGAAAPHVARHDPARVLAECEAKRRIVDEHSPTPGFDSGGYCPSEDGRWRQDRCPTLCALALPYADHPDYDDAWRP